MRTHAGLSLLIVVVSLAVFLTGNACLGDWDEGGSYKMHWPQLPDKTPMGIDISVKPPNILADDFLCTEDGPITNIHIWGSWSNDMDDQFVEFTLSIHADIPSNPPVQMYSMPGQTLWSFKFGPGQYTMRPYWTNVFGEGWMTPPTNYVAPPFGDHYIFQYNFAIAVPAAFVQTNGVIYWLDVQAKPLVFTNNSFGWKTCEPIWRWNDDSTWTTGSEPVVSGWTNLVYPPGHAIEGQTLDQAFVIEGGYPVPRPECTKWLQPPDCEIGVDVDSWGVTGVPMSGPRVADDWICDGRPVTAVRWWGSYYRYATNNPSPTNPPVGLRPLGFWLTWYADQPALSGGFSQPGGVIASNFFPLSGFATNIPGFVCETNECVTLLSFTGTEWYEHEYEYYVALSSNEWLEKEGAVYWLSVEAVYPMPPGGNFWGWKTTPPPWNWNDNAVYAGGAMPWTNMFYPPPGWTDYPAHPYSGQSVNMAFELLTDICPGRCKKWSQRPDMMRGQNMQSWRIGTNAGLFLRADDFVSDGRPITDIHWWGSYLGWMYGDSGSETNPIPAPMGANRPDGFLLSWHLNDPGPCLPTNAITNLFVGITNCHETYYGSVTQFWIGRYEHEYQYYVDLADPLIKSIWAETNSVHYWLNIQAVFSTNFIPGLVHSGWGWKIAPNTQACISAVSIDDGRTWRNDTVGVDGGPVHPREGDNFDLAFELTTTNVSGGNYFVDVLFSNIVTRAASDYAFMVSTGWCGCGKQVLQSSTNLKAGEAGWVGTQTNVTPRPVNFWTNSPLNKLRFFRVQQTD